MCACVFVYKFFKFQFYVFFFLCTHANTFIFQTFSPFFSILGVNLDMDVGLHGWVSTPVQPVIVPRYTVASGLCISSQLFFCLFVQQTRFSFGDQQNLLAFRSIAHPPIEGSVLIGSLPVIAIS